jgi:hypothetical protein
MTVLHLRQNLKSTFNAVLSGFRLIYTIVSLDFSEALNVTFQTLFIQIYKVMQLCKSCAKVSMYNFVKSFVYYDYK